jgi:hypothetical protein
MALPPLQDPDVIQNSQNSTLPKLQDPGAIPDSQTNAPAETSKQVPSFLDKLDMINSGVDRGVKYFTLSLLSKLPFGNKWQNAIKQVDKEATDVQNQNTKKFGGLYPGIGEVGGETLATLPFGSALGSVAKGADLVGNLLPTGLKTLGKYGTSAVGGAGVLAGMESQKYDPENPGQMINTEAAGQALSSPLSYVLPALGTKLSTWLGSAEDLGAAKEIFPNIMARNLKEPGATTTLSNMMFGIPAALTGMGKQAKQLNSIGDDVSNFIQKLAGTKSALTADNLTEYSANIMQSTLKKMSRAEDTIWDKGFKTALISDPQAVKDDVINAIDLLKTNKIPGYETTVNYLNNGIRKDNINVDDVKRLQTLVSGAAINAKGLEGGVGNQLASDLSDVKDNLMNHIQNSLSPDQMKDFSAARAFSANKFQLFNQAPMLQKALYDETSAHKLVNSLISEGGVLPPKRAAISILSPGGKNMLAATKLQQALESSDTAGHINLDSFLTKTSPYTQTKEILNKDAYGALQGLNTYLKNIDEASKVGWWRQAVIGGSIASAMGVGAIGAGATGLAVPLISYGAATLIANHSPLKTLLNGLVKASSKATGIQQSSIYDAISKSVSKQLTRAGLLMSQDGVLQETK